MDREKLVSEEAITKRKEEQKLVEELEDFIYKLSQSNGIQDITTYLKGIIPTSDWLLNTKLTEAIDTLDYYHDLERLKNFILKIYLKQSIDASENNCTYLILDFDKLVKCVGNDLEKREWERLKLIIKDVDI